MKEKSKQFSNALANVKHDSSLRSSSYPSFWLRFIFGSIFVNAAIFEMQFRLYQYKI